MTVPAGHYARPMDVTDLLVERSGDLKRQVLDFAQKPRFDKMFRQEIRRRFGPIGTGDEGKLYNFFDWFIQEYRLHDGRTVIDCFLESRRELPEAERDFLLRWRDVREGLFEVTGRDGSVLLTENLVDDLPYALRTNVGPSLFDQMPAGSFLYTRIVPVNDDVWLLSGGPRLYPATARQEVLFAAARLATLNPDLVFRNPEKVEAGWKQQRDQHAAFVRHFGTDEITISADDLATTMAGFWATFAGDPDHNPDTDTSWLDETAETVGIIFDETTGLGMYADYALAQAAFADPDLMRRRRYKEIIKAYLEEDSIDPVPLQRLAARHPDTVNRVIRAALGKPAFRWDSDGDQLLRQRKSSWYARPALPSVTVLSPRLAAALRENA